MELFTYGSFAPSGSLYSEIRASVVDECSAVFEGRLYAFPEGPPIIIEDGPGYPIDGVLLTLPDSPVVLQRLDTLLEVGRPNCLYLRVQRRVITDRGDTMAWIFLCKQDQAAFVASTAVEVT